MDLASEVRNRDIALKLLTGAPPLSDSTLAQVLSQAVQVAAPELPKNPFAQTQVAATQT